MVSSKFLSLVYHDIFDFPLSEGELVRWEVRGKKVDVAVGSGIQTTGEYYHLKGRGQIVKLRQEREKESIKKLKLARKICTKLFTIPTVRFIGVTGSLAMKNSKKESDIDLMVITSRGTLWTTRLIVYLATKLSSYQVRSADGTESKDAICFNMWLDEKHLLVPHKMRNLYSAHEVLQVVPLYNKGRTFEKFLEANKWTLDFWPKAHLGTRHWGLGTRKNALSIAYCLTPIALLIEPIAYWTQRLYMYRRITRETVEPGRAFFHPTDWSSIVLKEFAKRIEG